MHSAASAGNVEVVKFILEHGADRSKVNNYRNTILHLAASNGALEMAKMLVLDGMNIDDVNEDGLTPGLLAAFHGQVKVVKYLFAYGADHNVVDKYGNSILHMVARGAVSDEMKMSISDSATLNVVAEDESTPLNTVTIWGGSVEVLFMCLFRDGAP